MNNGVVSAHAVWERHLERLDVCAESVVLGSLPGLILTLDFLDLLRRKLDIESRDILMQHLT